jgi:phospholipid-binding lipoprotein MlaA
MARALAAALLLALLAPAGAIEAEPASDVQGAAAVPAEPSSDGHARSPGDPWEPFNRKIFAFNETVDHYALEPIATGWNTVVPDRVETCLANFFDNLQMPVHFANDLLQGKPWKAYETVWRVVVNTTVGLGGFFDPASAWQIYKSNEDFGQTLGVWGTPPGPYLVLPLLGPSSPRDATGMAVEAAATFPISWYFIPTYVSVPARSVDIVNRRALALETIREERKAAFDWYAAVRSAFTQYRENQVRDRAEAPKEPQETQEEDLYGLDEDE